MKPSPNDQLPTTASIERDLSALTNGAVEISSTDGDASAPAPSSKKLTHAPFEAPLPAEASPGKPAPAEAPPTAAAQPKPALAEASPTAASYAKPALAEAPPTTDAGLRDGHARAAGGRDEATPPEPSSGPATPSADLPPVALEALRAWLVPSPDGPRLLPWSRSRPAGAVEVVVVATEAGAHLRALLS
ncbi:MAG TPA: hypothetical protein VFS00_27075 [Polyangiaceae bacterium]|nr:hypothetical protein [Polyangiaceae bacterium]